MKSGIAQSEIATVKNIAIVGAGGCAREVAWLIRDINRVRPTYNLLGYVVSDLSALGPRDSTAEVIGDLSILSDSRVSIDCLALGIGTPAARLAVAREITATAPAIDWPMLVHPTAQFDAESCSVSRGVILCAGCISTVNITFAEFCLCGVSTTIGHESRIGACSVLNPSASISGGVSVGSAVLIGTGAQVLQYLEIGSGATVGAGAVVTKNVAAGECVVGVPAVPIHKAKRRDICKPTPTTTQH